MTKPLALALSHTALDRLHHAADGRGEAGTINKADLRLLLVDHAKALARLTDTGTTIGAPGET